MYAEGRDQQFGNVVRLEDRLNISTFSSSLKTSDIASLTLFTLI